MTSRDAETGPMTPPPTPETVEDVPEGAPETVEDVPEGAKLEVTESYVCYESGYD